MVKLWVMLLVPVLAVWTPLGRCCVLGACDAGHMTAEATPPASDASHTCAACAKAADESDAPAPTQTPEPHDCSCSLTMVAAPEHDALAPTAPHAIPLPALDLWIVLPYSLDLESAPSVRGVDLDADQPAPRPQSLLAQACQLSI